MCIGQFLWGGSEFQRLVGLIQEPVFLPGSEL